ncbi:MAG: hypothetical protein K0R51_1568 [Cytophagaceae bacterium]|jgi:hypothetical protein|nr:hypothetical protein [Cytophagaceae bacterium]
MKEFVPSGYPMKKTLLFFAGFFLLTWAVSAQTTGPFVVADNGNRLSSCADTLITLDYIYNKLAIHDLDDPNDNVSKYRILRLNGSVITEDVLTTFKYSDYSAVFIHKTEVPFSNGHAGVQVFLNIVTPPTSLFTADTLKYTVEKQSTINYVEDFFAHINIWSSGLDNVLLQDRLLFTDLEEGIERPISAVPDWSIRGEGEYRMRYAVAVCSPTDLFWDTMYVKVSETLCNSIKIKNAAPVCRDEVYDITPYVYVNNHVATPEELNDMTFRDRSLFGSQPPGTVIPDPTAINIASMYDPSTNYPIIDIAYQPNVTIGTCGTYNYFITTKVPTTISVSPTVITQDNYGNSLNFNLGGEFYGINDEFNKNTLKSMYIDNYNVFAGTVLDFYTDAALQNVVTGDNLVPGTYYVTATNSTCSNDLTKFTIDVKNRDFNIVWQGAQNIGTGYYDFFAPDYPGATYTWFVWGGSIVNGLNTKEIRVYYSENAAQHVSVYCKITLPAGRTTADGVMASALYLSATGEDGAMEVWEPQEVVTSVDEPVNLTGAVAYPNPAENTFMISGEGDFELSVYNTLGQLVFENKTYSANTPITIQSKGVHVVRLSQNNKSQTLKVVLK